MADNIWIQPGVKAILFRADRFPQLVGCVVTIKNHVYGSFYSGGVPFEGVDIYEYGFAVDYICLRPLTDEEYKKLNLLRHQALPDWNKLAGVKKDQV